MAKLGAHPQPLKWDAKQLEAVDLVFAGLLTYAEVAARVQTSESTVKRWVQHPEFRAKLAEKRADFRASIEDVTFADKARRVFALDRAAKIAFAELQARPLLREVRPLPQKAAIRMRTKGEDGEDKTEETEPLDAIVNESFNRDAFESFRGALDDIAKELGDRKQQTEITGKIDVNLLAAEADARFYSFVDASAGPALLGGPDTTAEG